MADKTSWALAVSGTCDNTPENRDAFVAIFESAVRAARAMDGHEDHNAANGQFFGRNFANAEVYLTEAGVKDAVAATSIKK